MKWAWLWTLLSLAPSLIKQGVEFGLELVFAKAIEAVKSSETNADDKSVLTALEAVYDWVGAKIVYLKEVAKKAEEKRGP